jgi:hypothetical protein
MDAYKLNPDGLLDLSDCYFKNGDPDYFSIRDISHAYFEAELSHGIIAWDGVMVTGFTEQRWRHLVSIHGKDDWSHGFVTCLEIERVKRLPLLKRVVSGEFDMDILTKIDRNGTTVKLDVGIEGIAENYLVSLGVLNGRYLIRSAYPSYGSYIKHQKDLAIKLERYHHG